MSVIDLTFIGSSSGNGNGNGSGPQASIQASQPLAGKVNYFIGNSPSKWHTNIPTYGEITYGQLYPGVDLTYSGVQGALKSTYTVDPKADPSAIRWRYAVDEGSQQGKGASTPTTPTAGQSETMTVDTAGNLQVSLAGGTQLTEHAPIAWQEINGQRVSVDAHYVVTNDGSAAFRLGAYDHNYQLTIDPTLTYATYFGGSSTDWGKAVAVDAAGDMFIAGQTASTDITTTHCYQCSKAASYDVFITKFNPQGSDLIYSTYLGGNNGDGDYLDLAVDASGNAYVGGKTYSSDFPSVNAWQSQYCGGQNGTGFVSRLDPSGSSLIYSTYLGTCGINASTTIMGIATDGKGHAFVTGVLDANHPDTFPLVHPIQGSFGGGNSDAFVSEINTNSTYTSSLAYSTYLGGSLDDQGHSIFVDLSGKMYVGGITSSTNFTTTNAYQGSNAGGQDGFVTVLNAAGSALVYSTYLGGGGTDSVNDITVDSSGSLYAVGTTDSTNFPHVNAYHSTNAGLSDAFLTKFNPQGNTLAYSTYLGGTGNDSGNGVAVDYTGSAYVVGATNSASTFPIINAFQPTFGGGNNDGFVTRFDPSGSSLMYSSFLGGNEGTVGTTEAATSAALDFLGNLYVTGVTAAHDFPVTANAYQPNNRGDHDAFLAEVLPLPFTGITDTRVIMGNNCSLNSCLQPSTPHPVNLATGNFWHSFTDLSVPGRGIPLQFSRTYNSLTSNQRGSPGSLGYGWTDNYNMYVERDGAHNYVVHQANGTVVLFNPDMSAQPIVGAVLTNTGTLDGSLIFTLTHGLTTFHFRPLTDTVAPGMLDHMTDRNGYTTSLSYNGNGTLHTVTDPANRQLSFNYTVTNTVSYLTGVTDPANRTVSFGYDSSGNLQTATDIGGQRMGFTYETVSGYHRPLTMTDPNGGVLTNQYDTSNRVVTQTDPLNRATNFGYVSGSTRMTDTLNNVTVYNFNNYILTQIIGNANASQDKQAVTSYYYNPGTISPAAVVDPLNNRTSMVWDVNGNLLSTTDPLSRTTSYAYNSTNDPTVITNSLGITTTFGYDAFGNVTSVTSPLTQAGQLVTSTLGYDPAHHGDLTTVTNPLTHTWNITYDTYGYVYTSTNPVNNTITYTHNLIGWLTQVTDPMNYSATVSYNNYGDPLVITDTRHYTTTYTYDNDENLVHATDANFRSITNTYDLDNELTRATQPDGTHSDYLYDGYGRAISQTNGLGQTTLYTYDDVNRINTVTDPLNRTASSAYDLVGNTTVITDARSLTTTYGYDNAYQLTGITYHDSGTTPNVSYVYDNLGRRTVMTDGTGTSLYYYDSLNRLTSYQNGAGNSMGYGYDLASRITSITYPGTSHTVTRGYDDANRVTSVQDWLNHTTSFGYNQDGALTSQSYPNSTQMTVGRDAAQEVTSITHVYTPTSSNIVSFTYSYDPVGVLSSTVDSPTGSHSYSYDQLYRLLGDQIPGVTGSNWTYSYDAGTEITSTTTYINGGKTTTGTRTFDAADELKTLVETQGGTTTRKLSLTYNNNGDRLTLADSVSGVSNAYTYDQEDRLTKYTSGGTTSFSYGYNGDGLRMSKLNNLGGPPPPKPGVPGVPTPGQNPQAPLVGPIQYTWDIAEGLPLMVQDAGGSYIYGPGAEIVEQIDNSNNAYYYHADQLGSIRAVTNSSGTVADSYSYDAYGNTTASSGTVLNQFKYAGEYQDAESNLYYLRARYYDPATQQFLTIDPLVSGTEQPYGYVGGSPTNLRDPSGMGPCDGPFEEVCQQAAEAAEFAAEAVQQAAEVELEAAIEGTQQVAETLAEKNAAAIQNIEEGDLVGLLKQAISNGQVARDAASQEIGSMDPNEVYFSQDSCRYTYQDTKFGNIDDTINELKSGATTADQIEPIRIVRLGNKLFSIDNRRLVTFQKAGLNVNFRWATPSEAWDRLDHFTTKNGGTSIVVRGAPWQVWPTK
jgi:RHS repeat-associated protein